MSSTQFPGFQGKPKKSPNGSLHIDKCPNAKITESVSVGTSKRVVHKFGTGYTQNTCCTYPTAMVTNP